MSDHLPSDRSASPRDLERKLKEVLYANPRDTLEIFCGVTLRDGDVVTVEQVDLSGPGNYQHDYAISADDYRVQMFADRVMEVLGKGDRFNTLEQSKVGREIARKNREEGRVDAMRAALQAAYGDITDLDELARRLVDRDHTGNIARIVAGATMADLRA